MSSQLEVDIGEFRSPSLLQCIKNLLPIYLGEEFCCHLTPLIVRSSTKSAGPNTIHIGVVHQPFLYPKVASLRKIRQNKPF